MQNSLNKTVIGKDYFQIEEKLIQLAQKEMQQLTELQIINTKDYFTIWVQAKRQKYNKEVDAKNTSENMKFQAKSYMEYQYWRDHQQMSQLFYSQCFAQYFESEIANNSISDLIGKCSNLRSLKITFFHGFYNLDFFDRIAQSLNRLSQLEKVEIKITGKIHLYLWGGKNWTSKLIIKPQINVESKWIVQ